MQATSANLLGFPALDRPLTVALADAEPGTGWQAVTVDGAPWGQARTRDRMRVRRD